MNPVDAKDGPTTHNVDCSPKFQKPKISEASHMMHTRAEPLSLTVAEEEVTGGAHTRWSRRALGRAGLLPRPPRDWLSQGRNWLDKTLSLAIIAGALGRSSALAASAGFADVADGAGPLGAASSWLPGLA